MACSKQQPPTRPPTPQQVVAVDRFQLQLDQNAFEDDLRNLRQEGQRIAAERAAIDELEAATKRNDMRAVNEAESNFSVASAGLPPLTATARTQSR